MVTAVTRAGTNQLHGSVFEFVRNSAFDAKNFFDALTPPIPPFKRNQFGAEVDGPIVRNKTFFLASYEGLRQRLGVTSRTVVPDPNARQGILPNQPRITVSPSVPGYLNLIPLPNGRDFGDGTGEYIASASQATGENFGAARIDHQLSGSTFLFARYTYDSGMVSVPDGLSLVRSDSKSRNQYSTVEATRVFSERLLDTFRFSFNPRTLQAVFCFSDRSIHPYHFCQAIRWARSR